MFREFLEENNVIQIYSESSKDAIVHIFNAQKRFEPLEEKRQEKIEVLIEWAQLRDRYVGLGTGHGRYVGYVLIRTNNDYYVLEAETFHKYFETKWGI